MEVTYTLDKLVAWLRVSSLELDKILRVLNGGVSAEYGVVQKSFVGKMPYYCQMNYTIAVDSGDTYFLGIGKYADAPNEFWTNVKVEFNPAKLRYATQFHELYDRLIFISKHVEFGRFDVAIDIPLNRDYCRIFKDRRSYKIIDNGGDNVTQYVGERSAHGEVKLYNKSRESKLPYDLTRLEITLDYAKSGFKEFQRIFPMNVVFDVSNIPDEITGTDKILMLACFEHPEYLNDLERKKRKKIEQLFEAVAQSIKPDEIYYKTILTEILSYGNRIALEKWTELEEKPDVFPPKMTEMTGEQEEM